MTQFLSLIHDIPYQNYNRSFMEEVRRAPTQCRSQKPQAAKPRLKNAAAGKKLVYAIRMLQRVFGQRTIADVKDTGILFVKLHVPGSWIILGSQCAFTTTVVHLGMGPTLDPSPSFSFQLIVFDRSFLQKSRLRHSTLRFSAPYRKRIQVLIEIIGSSPSL